MCGQLNVRASAEDNAGQIKIPDPAGNQTWAAGLEGRDSTDHAMATDSYNSPAVKIISPSAKFQPNPSIHVAPLMTNDVLFPEEIYAGQVSKILIFGLQHSFKNYKESRQR